MKCDDDWALSFVGRAPNAVWEQTQAVGANAAHACEGFAPKRLLLCEGFAPKRLSLCEGFAPKRLSLCEGFAPKRLSLCEG